MANLKLLPVTNLKPLDIWEEIRSKPGGDRDFEFSIESLLTKLLSRHDFGLWTHPSLDGGAAGSSIVTDETDTTITVSQVYATLGGKRGKNKFGILPIMLKLKFEDGKLKYNIKLERIEIDRNSLRSNNLYKHLFLLAHGQLRREWVWGYDASGTLE